MAYWLVKSEPLVYSWEQFVKDKRTTWDGIRSYASRINLNAMKKGDEVLFYHSNKGMEIVGIAAVVKEAYPDNSSEKKDWVAIDLKPIKKLKQPVPLMLLKSDKRFSNMDLVRLGRLSVQKVMENEWNLIMELAGDK